MTVVTLLNGHLLSRAPGVWLLSHSSRNTREIEIEVYRSQVLEGVHCIPQRAIRAGQGKIQAERTWHDLGHMPLSGSSGETGVPWLSPDWSGLNKKQTKNSRSLVRVVGCLMVKGCTGGRSAQR